MDKNKPAPVDQQDKLVTVYRLRDDLWSIIKEYLNSLPWSQVNGLLVKMFDEYGSSPHYTKQGIQTLTSFLKDRPRAEVKDLMLALGEEDALQAYTMDPDSHESQQEGSEGVSEGSEESDGGEATQKVSRPRKAKGKARKSTNK